MHAVAQGNHHSSVAVHQGVPPTVCLLPYCSAGVKSYELGNDFSHITIVSKRVYDNVQAKVPYGSRTASRASP